MDTISRFTTNADGRAFEVEISYDFDHAAPWEDYDGHGIVSEWTTREKRAGERILWEDGRSRRYYDVATTQTKALAEGWQASTASAAYGTAREQAARAVDADFQRLRAWCENEWCYVVVGVREILDPCACCGTPQYGEWEYLGGVESDDAYYHEGGGGLEELMNEAAVKDAA